MANSPQLETGQGCAASERLVRLNKIAIHQMKLLTEDRSVKKLEKKDGESEKLR